MSATFSRLEKCLYPPPQVTFWNGGSLRSYEYTTAQKTLYCVKNFFTFTALLLLSPLTATYDWLTTSHVTTLPKESREEKKYEIAPAWLPRWHGFACSFFQTSGLGTRWAAGPTLDGVCDWEDWMTPRHIIGGDQDYSKFFTDILSNPVPYVAMLKSHHVTAHRFSLEWAVIQPRRGAAFDVTAVKVYKKFISTLQSFGITPSITLCHFVVPKWFHRSGGFQNSDNIDSYVQFATQAMETFFDVESWWSFNELGIKAFQQAREAYPVNVPEGSRLSKRVHAAGIATQNMLIAHCKLYKKVSTSGSSQKLGVTHQWLKFDMATGNWLERLVSYYLTKFAFTPVYQFFKEGTFSFQFPFMTNIQFSIPKPEFNENEHFLMQLGLQAYPAPMVKMGRNHGHIYPGIPSTIPFFSFGASCEPGGTLTRLGTRWRAEALDEYLDEAYAITSNVCITEIGAARRIQKWGSPRFVDDDEAQAAYLQQLIQKVASYCQKRERKLLEFYIWSDLRRQMEWDSGLDCVVALIDPEVNPTTRQMIGWKSSPASEYVAKVFSGGLI